jgi:hypothetical protein
VKAVPERIALAKASPETISFVSAAVATIGYLSPPLLNQQQPIGIFFERSIFGVLHLPASGRNLLLVL